MLVDPSMVEMLKELQMPGMPDPVVEILEIFEADAVQVVARLQDAAEAGDIEGVRMAAHRLKGAAGNLGATELCRVLSRVEEAARSGLLRTVASEVASTPQLVAATLKELQALA